MRRMSSRLALVLTVCAAAALTACGGGSSKKTPAAVPLTEAKAKTVAAAGILTAADLPGYTAADQTHDASNDETDKKLATCLGVPAETYLTRNFGKSFTKGQLEIDSSVDVATSAASARTQLTALTSSKAPDCLKSTLTELLATSGLTVTSFTATPTSVRVSGADATFGYKLAFAGAGKGQQISFSGYEVGSLVGQVQVAVSVLASSAGTFSFDDTVALLTTATGRVKAAS